MPHCNAERAARKATIDKTVKGIASSILNIDLRHVSHSINEVNLLALLFPATVSGEGVEDSLENYQNVSMLPCEFN